MGWMHVCVCGRGVHGCVGEEDMFVIREKVLSPVHYRPLLC